MIFLYQRKLYTENIQNVDKIWIKQENHHHAQEVNAFLKQTLYFDANHNANT